MTADHLTLLKAHLNEEFVPELPPVLNTTHRAEHMAVKNTARALSAFAIYKIVGTDHVTTA